MARRRRAPSNTSDPPQKSRTDRIIPLLPVVVGLIGAGIAYMVFQQTRHRDTQQAPIAAGTHIVQTVEAFGHLDSAEMQPIADGLESVSDTATARVLRNVAAVNQRQNRKAAPVMLPANADSADRLLADVDHQLSIQAPVPLAVATDGTVSLESSRIAALTPALDSSQVNLPSGNAVSRLRVNGLWQAPDGQLFCAGACAQGQICCIHEVIR